MSPFTYVLTTNGLLFLLSIIFFKFPPKKINQLYGYRTYRTMKNDAIWNFANTVFNKNLLIYAGISFLAGLLYATISKNVTWQPMVLVMLTLLVCIIKTEKSISEVYDSEGNQLNTKK